MLHTCTFQSMYTISILSPSRIFLHIPCDVEGATHYMEYILYVTVVVCPAPLLSGGVEICLAWAITYTHCPSWTPMSNELDKTVSLIFFCSLEITLFRHNN